MRHLRRAVTDEQPHVKDPVDATIAGEAPAQGQLLDPSAALLAQGMVGNAAVSELLHEQTAEEEAALPVEDRTAEVEERPPDPAEPPEPPPVDPVGEPVATPPVDGAPPSSVPDDPKGEGGPAALDTGSALGLVHSLEEAAASQLLPTYNAALGAAPTMLEATRATLAADLPEFDAPTGLPAEAAPRERPDLERAEPDFTLPAGHAGGVDPAPLQDTTIALSPPKQPAVVLREGSGEGNDPELADSGRAALAAVRTDAGIPVQSGLDGRVALTGEADPTRMVGVTEAAGLEVALAGSEAMTGAAVDFGEHTVAPEPIDTRLSVSTELAGLGLDVPPVDDLGLPAEVSTGFDPSVAPLLTQRIGEATADMAPAEARFESDVEAAHVDAHSRIADATDQARIDQLTERSTLVQDVDGERAAWRADITQVQQDARLEADAARAEQLGQITTRRAQAETEARQHIVDAEQRADTERERAEAEAETERRRAEEESGGFWGWARSAVRAVVDAVVSTVNAIFDQLRQAVQAIFAAAKVLVQTVVEVARLAIVGYITVFYEVVKVLVRGVLFAFPELADRYCARIDAAVARATERINAIAGTLVWAVNGILDFLGSTLDKALHFVQAALAGVFTLVGMFLTGEWTAILQGLGWLVEGIGEAWRQRDVAAYEEITGDLSQPLPPVILEHAGITAPAALPAADGAIDHATPQAPWTTENVGVSPFIDDAELSPAIWDEVLGMTDGIDGDVPIIESNETSRSIEAILGPGAPATAGPTAQVAQFPDDGLTPAERGPIKFDFMMGQLMTWLAENWPLLAVGTVAALGAFVGLNLLTGGALMAAMPVIMGVLGKVFVGVMTALVADHIRQYVSLSWAGDPTAGGKSLAKAVVVLAMELIGILTFRVGSGVVKAARRGASGLRSAMRTSPAAGALRRGADFAMDRGRVMLRGVRNSAVGRTAQRLDDLGRRLLEQTRFRGFFLRIRGTRWTLFGRINPDVPLMSGKVPRKPGDAYSGPWPPSGPPGGPKPRIDTPEGLDWRYQRYLWMKHQRGASADECFSREAFERRFISPARSGGRPGRHGGPEQQRMRDELVREEGMTNTETTKLGTRPDGTDNYVDGVRKTDTGTDYFEVDVINVRGKPPARIRRKLQSEVDALQEGDRLIYVDKLNRRRRLEYKKGDVVEDISLSGTE